MIPRYQRPEMAEIWSDANRLRTMFRIELLASEAMAAQRLIPGECHEALRKVQPHQINPERVAELERSTRHETVAFLTHVEELAGPENARFLHFGMTSSDVLDTCFSLQLKSASDLLIAGLDRMCDALKRRALEHRLTLCPGRTHGVHAEPTTFGLKLASAYAEMRRNRERMTTARREISFGAVSGPVGTFSGAGPEIEAHVCARLGLSPEPVSTQVIPRDRHAAYFSVLGLTASSLERIATEIRSLQRTEILEIEESFSAEQKGSSAMPHKRNPILAENVTGLARWIRAQAPAALENVPLWHERDMSHSSVERIIAPDMTLALDFSLNRMTGIIDRMTVHGQRMRQNMELTRGAHCSHRVLSALVATGAGRSRAHALVQKNAARVHQEGITFLNALKSDPEVTALLAADELPELFDDSHFTQHVDAIFDRVFNPPSA